MNQVQNNSIALDMVKHMCAEKAENLWEVLFTVNLRFRWDDTEKSISESENREALKRKWLALQETEGMKGEREWRDTHTHAGDVEMTWNYWVQSNHKSPSSVLFLFLLPFTLANYPYDGFTFFPVKNKHVLKLFYSADQGETFLRKYKLSER